MPDSASPPPDTMLARLRAEALDILAGVREAAIWLLRLPLYIWLRGAIVVAVVVAWELGAGYLPRGFFATPDETSRALADMLNDYRQIYLLALADTLQVYFGGLALAALVGVPLGLMFGASALVGRTLNPFLNALAATPLIALMPMVILFFGLGPGPKMLIVMLGAVMPVLINSYTGIRGTDPRLAQFARAYDLHWATRWRHVILPQAFHPIMAGLRLGATTGLVTTVIADLYMSMTGLGSLLVSYGNSFQMGAYFVTVLSLAIIGVFTTGALALVERMLTPAPSRKRLFS